MANLWHAYQSWHATHSEKTAQNVFYYKLTANFKPIVIQNQLRLKPLWNYMIYGYYLTRFIKYFHGSVVLEKMPSEKQLQSHNESIITYAPANDDTVPFYQDNYSIIKFTKYEPSINKLSATLQQQKSH